MVDSASIEVNRRARRAKTDRLDALKLVRMLVRVCYGEQRCGARCACRPWRTEAARQVSRERTALTQEQTRLINQMRGLAGDVGRRAAVAPPRRLVDDGARLGGRGAARRSASAARARGGAPRRCSRGRSRSSTRQQQAAVTAAAPASALRQLVQLKGVATTSASVLLDEGLVWRAFRNRRQIGGLLGFAPTPVRQRGVGAGARDQSRRQYAAASDQHSAGVELGALATAQRPDAVVSGAFRDRASARAGLGSWRSRASS